MTGVADPRLETALRRVLAEARPATDAPAELRARIDRIPDLAAPARLRSSLRTVLAAAAGLVGAASAAAVALALLARLADLPIGPFAIPPAGSGPSPQAFDPTIEGPGVLSSVESTLTTVPWLVAFLGIGIAVLVAAVNRRRRWILVASLAVAVALGAGAYGLAGQRGFEFGSFWGHRSGFDVIATAPPGSNGPDTWYVTAEPGQPFVFAISIRNPGPLPITYRGVVEPNGTGVQVQRWAAAWQVDDFLFGDVSEVTATAFHPVEVAPGGQVALYVVGRASECAMGSRFTLEQADALGLAFMSRSSITIAYSVAGLTATSEFELPMVLAQPIRDGCP